MNILLQHFAQTGKLRGFHRAFWQDTEACGRGVQENLFLAFRPTNVVLPGNVGRAAIPTPVHAVGVEDYSAGALCSWLLTELALHHPSWPGLQGKNKKKRQTGDWQIASCQPIVVLSDQPEEDRNYDQKRYPEGCPTGPLGQCCAVAVGAIGLDEIPFG